MSRDKFTLYDLAHYVCVCVYVFVRACDTMWHILRRQPATLLQLQPIFLV